MRGTYGLAPPWFLDGQTKRTLDSPLDEHLGTGWSHVEIREGTEPALYLVCALRVEAALMTNAALETDIRGSRNK